jgi:hypothetical protein
MLAICAPDNSGDEMSASRTTNVCVENLGSFGPIVEILHRVRWLVKFLPPSQPVWLWHRSRRNRPAGYRTLSRQAAGASPGRTARRRSAPPSQLDRARPDAGNRGTTRSGGRAQPWRRPMSSAGQCICSSAFIMATDQPPASGRWRATCNERSPAAPRSF